MPEDPAAIFSPADSKALVGSFRETSQLFLKGKFFDFDELLGVDKKNGCGLSTRAILRFSD